MTRSKLLGLLLVIAYIAGLQILAALGINSIFEHRLLLPVLNTLFAGMIPVAVAFIAGRSYLKTGSATILFMGCGMLSFGLCAISAGWMIRAAGGPNLNVTVYNTGALVGALFHSIGAVVGLRSGADFHRPGRERAVLFTAYIGIFIFLIGLSLATLQGLTPPFFIQGAGPTGLRQLVLGNAVFLYAFSSMFLIGLYLRRKSDFLYWYALSLAMLSIGLFAFFVQKSVGCPIGWLGRSANYLGCVMAVVAVARAWRDAKTRGVCVDASVAALFADAETRYRDLVETATDAIISFDRKERIIAWNSAAEKMFGWTRAPAEGAPFFETCFSEEFIPLVKREIESLSVSSEGPLQSKSIELRAKRSDGGLFPAEISLSARKLGLVGIGVCILRDITQRKETDDALRDSERRYRSLFDNMLDGFAYCKMLFEDGKPQDFIYLHVNEAFEKLTGLKNVVGRKVTEVIPGIRKSNPELFEIYGKTARSGRSDKFETYLDSLGIWLSVSVYSTEADHFVAVFDNITERKAGEKEIKGSEARLRQSQAMAHLGSWELDVVNNTLTWSDEVYKIFGLRPREFNATYEAFLGAVHPDDRKAVDEAYSGSLRDGKDAYEIEHRVVRKSTGEVRTVHEKCEHARDPSGQIIRSVGMVHDITERKAGEEALRKAHDELEIRVRERTFELETAKNALATERQRLFDILETLPIMVCLLTPDHRVVFSNNSFRERFGADNERRCFEFIFGSKESCTFCRTYSVFETGKPVHWEFVTPNGAGVIDVYAFPFADVDGSPLILEMNIDLTEQRRAQEIVKAEREQFYNVMETLPVYLALLTPDHQMPFTNRVFRERFGEPNGKRCFEHLTDKNEPCEDCEPFTVLKTMQPRQWEWIGPDKRVYEVHNFPLRTQAAASSFWKWVSTSLNASLPKML
jgi:PAS domain S-box-containing protein